MFARMRCSVGSIASIAVLLSVSLTAQAQNQSHSVVRWNVKHDVSAPLSEMIKNAPKASTLALSKHEAEPVRRIPLPPGMSGAAAVQDLRFIYNATRRSFVAGKQWHDSRPFGFRGIQFKGSLASMAAICAIISRRNFWSSRAEIVSWRCTMASAASSRGSPQLSTARRKSSLRIGLAR